MLSLHTAILSRTSAFEDVEIAKAAGFDAVELQISKLGVLADNPEDLARLKKAAGTLRVSMLDCLLGVEDAGPSVREANLDLCERMARAAAALGCPHIQVVALDAFRARSAARRRIELRRALEDFIARAESQNVVLALEPVVFSPFNNLQEAVALVDDIGPARLKLVLDVWHLWCAGTAWKEVAELDPDWIACVQIGDGCARSGPAWCDADRGALPGQGIVPVREAVSAIRSTGFQGPWTAELFAGGYENWPALSFATEAGKALRECLAH